MGARDSSNFCYIPWGGALVEKTRFILYILVSYHYSGQVGVSGRMIFTRLEIRRYCWICNHETQLGILKTVLNQLWDRALKALFQFCEWRKRTACQVMILIAPSKQRKQTTHSFQKCLQDPLRYSEAWSSPKNPQEYFENSDELVASQSLLAISTRILVIKEGSSKNKHQSFFIIQNTIHPLSLVNHKLKYQNEIQLNQCELFF